MSLNYKDAGVDVEKGDLFIESMHPLIKSTFNDAVKTDIGGFAALYDIGDRYLCASTDGVGTKLKLAIELNRHETIGIDLVAMCVNDLICTGAKPLFFLDYLATGKLELSQAQSILKGIVAGCKEASCALIGGETAEMPGMYSENHYDLAGFSVGDVSKDKVLDGSKIRHGASIISLNSSGFHSNGFSLVREMLGGDDHELKLECLTPTKIYVRTVLDLIQRGLITGVANITGGGISNIPRINKNFGYKLNKLLSYESIPPHMKVIIERTKLNQDELYKTFNMGMGMVVITDAPDETLSILKELNCPAQLVGEASSDFKGVKIT